MDESHGPPPALRDLLFSSGQSDASSAIVGVDGRGITYGMLRAGAMDVVGCLEGAGFKVGDRVALVMPNGPLLASALVAVSTAFCCAPLNPGYRAKELEGLLVRLKAKALLLKKEDGSPARGVARSLGIEVLEVDEAPAGEISLAGRSKGSGAEPEFSGPGVDAFLLHTSGTTGSPKLVPLTQSNICHSVHYIRNAMELGPGDRCLNVMPLFHGLGLVSLLSTLLSGGSIVCAPAFYKDDFFQWLDRLEPTWYTAVPPVHQAVLDGAASHVDVVARSRLRFIRSAAAPLPARLMLGLEACFRAPVVEAYGMTEAFLIGSMPLPPRKRKPGSVGIAMGPEMSVMGEDGELAGNGVTGEIVVRGPSVMRGYEGDDEENSKSFTRGWFRTGDLGHVDGDGYIFIDGRVKEAVNRGGEKVTPNEVDDVLGTHPAVAEAATFGFPHEALGEDLAAAVILKDGAGASAGDLQLFVSERLALYKVPSRIFFVEEIPKGPSGKILRRRLPEILGLGKAGEGVVSASAREKIPPKTPAKEAGLIAEWNAATTEYPRWLCIHQIFEDIVAKSPSRIAIMHNGTELTYAELNAMANRLARGLMAEGVGLGEFVGVYMERSPDLVVSFLAILKAGASYVPIFPPSDSIERVTSYVEGAGIKLVLTKKVYEPMLPTSVRKLYYQRIMDALAGSISTNMPTLASPEGPAFLLHVPNAKGKPKGVCVPHRAVRGLVLNTNYVSIGADDVIAFGSSPDTDLAAWEIWGALLNGARMTIFNMRALLLPKAFAKKLAEDGVTILGLSTPFFNLYASEVPGAFRALKTLIFTGEVADPQSVRRVIENGPPKRLINAYGSTETTCFSTWHLIEGLPEGDAPIPIGVPVSNTTIHILDDALQPVPLGSEGELYIGGDGVALGYLNQPEATMESFLPDPFRAGGTMYRTGDMARLNPGGWVEFLGRRDRQIKIHGHRAELGEIESALLKQPAVRACSVAYMRVAGEREKRLVAYVVLSGRDPTDTRDLRTSLQRQLLEYMIPSQFVWVDELPIAPKGGQVHDHRVTGMATGGADEMSEVGDDVERRLVAIWEREMGIGRIKPGDSFFDLGGYSLIAVRIFSRMEEEFGVRLNIATIYREPTLAGMAAELRKVQPKALRSLVPLRVEGKRPKLFLAHAIDGEVYNYGELVRALGEDQPVYGLRAVGIHEDAPLPPTIEEMASCYIREIKTVQPSGPYHLAGWCAGAAIAYEMAQQLRREGDEVGLVGILDFEAPSDWRQPSRREARGVLLRETLFLGADILKYARRRRLARSLEMVQRVLRIEKLGMRALGIITTDEVMLHGEFVPLPERWKAAILNNQRVLRSYRLARYGGIVTVFKRETLPLVSSPDPTDGWREFAGGGVVVIPISGRMHYNMVKPPWVKETARGIRERMDWHERNRPIR